MPPSSVNYDLIAPVYDTRYRDSPLPGVTGLLRQAAAEAGGRKARALEVGCGTGHWLATLADDLGAIIGLDLSAGMLGQARRQAPAAPVVQGEAGALPFAAGAFDLVICVNALHHFPDKRAFIAEARRLLRPGGAWVNSNMDPHAGRDRWYLYDYFPGTLETDLGRFPSAGELSNWASEAGFERTTALTSEHIHAVQRGRAVLADPFLAKHGTSQLALLSDEAYAAGVARLKRDLDEAEAQGQALEFDTDLWMSAVVAQVGE
jgi:SAM-dependent methyltransferase